MNQITSDNVIIHNELPDVLFDFDKAAIDVETFGQAEGRIHRPEGRFGSLAATSDGKNVHMIYEERRVKEFLRRINAAEWQGHNLQYDMRQLRRFADIPDRKNILDTMLLEQIRFSGYYSGFSLADLYRRYCGGYLPKEERKSFSDPDGRMTDEKIFYSACDVVAQWHVSKEQSAQVDEGEMWTWENIERPFLWTLLDTGGVLFDSDAWMKIADEKAEGAADLFEKMSAKYGINPRSPKQLSEFLVSEGIDLPQTPSGGYSTNVKVLEKYRGKHELIDTVLDYRPLQKGASTYGENWLQYVESDGRIYTSWNQSKAKTSRMSSDSPALQNIPVRKGKEYRYCFIAADGSVFVIGDWSSQEPRIATYLCQDPNLIEIMNDPNKDIYIETGFHVLGTRFPKKDVRRKEMKATFLGLDYNMSASGLKAKLDQDIPDEEHTLEYAEQLRDGFFDAFPGLNEYIKHNINQARRNGYVETIWGRKLYISPYDFRIEQEAPNYSIQGSAGESMKVSANKLRKHWIKEFGYNPIRLFVHDEMVIEVPKEHAEYAKETMEDIMIGVAEEMHEGIRAAADVSIGKSWGDKE